MTSFKDLPDDLCKPVTRLTVRVGNEERRFIVIDEQTIQVDRPFAQRWWQRMWWWVKHPHL